MLNPLEMNKLVLNDFTPLTKEFQSDDPFLHVVVDNFLDEKLAHYSNEFPNPDDKKWFRYDKTIERKSISNS